MSSEPSRWEARTAGIILVLIPVAYCGKSGSFSFGQDWFGGVFAVLLSVGFILGALLIGEYKNDD